MPISPLSAQWLISIHAPRTGSDAAARMTRQRGANFNPRSPHGERLPVGSQLAVSYGISIHAPRTGSDPGHGGRAHGAHISIHAPRTGSDSRGPTSSRRWRHFNPRSPHGERRHCQRHPQQAADFNPRSPHGERRSWGSICAATGHFNPRSPHGERRWQHRRSSMRRNFNPRSPHGERHYRRYGQLLPNAFQSTLPARGATM